MTEIIPDIVNGVNKLTKYQFNSASYFHTHSTQLHYCCRAHVINLAVRESMALIRNMVQDVCSMVSSICSSTKPWDIYQADYKASRLNYELPGHFTWRSVGSEHLECWNSHSFQANFLPL